MSYTAVLDAESFGAAFAIESAFGTEGTSWEWLDCTLPVISPEVNESTTIRAAKSRGAGTIRDTGHRWYRVAFSAPLHGQVSGYAFAADTPTCVGIMRFLEALDGSVAQAYAAANLTTNAGATIDASTSPSVGALLAGGAAGAVSALGWPTAYSSPAATLFESLPVAPGTSVARYATHTRYPAATKGADWSFSFRVVGDVTTQDIRLRGCAVSKLTIRREGDRPWVDVEFVGYSGKADLTGGGLQVPTVYRTLEPRLGRGGDRAVVGANVIAALRSASYAPDGTCDIRDLTLTIDFPHQLVRCGPRPEGIAAVGLLAPVIQASFWSPKVAFYEVAGVNIFEDAWLRKTPISVSSYFGDSAGSILCWRIPRGHVTAHPSPTIHDRVWGWAVTLEAGHYDADSSSANAGDKPFTLGIG